MQETKDVKDFAELLRQSFPEESSAITPSQLKRITAAALAGEDTTVFTTQNASQISVQQVLEVLTVAAKLLAALTALAKQLGERFKSRTTEELDKDISEIPGAEKLPERKRHALILAFQHRASN